MATGLERTAISPMTGQPGQPDLTLTERAIESGLRLYDRFADRSQMPTNRRIFLETVLDRSRQPITEQSFKPQELQYIRELVFRPYQMNAEQYAKYGRHLESVLDKNKTATKDKRLYPEVRQLYEKQLAAINAFQSGRLTQDFIDLAAGKQYIDQKAEPKQWDESGVSTEWANFKGAFQIRPAVTYENYAIDPQRQTSDIRTDRTATAGSLPREAVHLTLGQFGYKVNPVTGGLEVIDTYDFNPPNFMGAPTSARPAGVESVGTAIEGSRGDAVYNILRNFAGRVTPPGQGRPVQVNLGAGLESTAASPLLPQQR
jgi:hypothetical protein